MSDNISRPSIPSSLLPSHPSYGPLLSKADERGHGNATRGAGAGAAGGAMLGSFVGPVGVGVGSLIGGLAGFFAGQSRDR